MVERGEFRIFGILIEIQKMFKDEGKLIMEAPTSNANIFLKYFQK